MNLSVKKILTFLIPLVIGMIFGVIFLGLFRNSEFLSPFISSPEISAAHIQSDKPIIAFLPYWNVNDVQIQYHLIDYLAYFGIGLNYDGTIKTNDDHNADMGWYYLNEGKLDEIFANCDKTEVKKMIVITAFNNELIDTITSNPDSKQAAIASIAKLVEDYGFSAVNLDFEYNFGQDLSSNAGAGYVQFISDLKQQIPGVEISVCLYANAIIKDAPYYADRLAAVADHLIFMAYDFYRADSGQAGPIAPVNSTFGVNINQTIDAAIKKNIDLNKIILAMPFYGYEWRTTSVDYGANTYPNTGAMASYKRVHKLIADRNLTADWNVLSMSPYLAYQDDNGFTQQIYYENDRSIGLKLELIDQTNLGGAAIWAIGYEGSNASVWNVIESWRRGE